MPLQATSGAASYDAFGGGVAAVPNYIEDVFSTYLYTGNGSTQTITNGIDLSTKGGLVWAKARSSADNHGLYDTARGVENRLISNSTAAQSTASGVTAFNANGFSLGSNSDVNGSGKTTVSWTFREQPKFFDVVTWTGDGATSKTISHNLGATPGCIITKSVSYDAGVNDSWYVYHRSLTTPNNKFLRLSSTNAVGDIGSNMWNVTSTTFSVLRALELNTNGQTYVAYLFAHNAGGFGLTGTDNVISCGSYTGTGGDVSVTLGYEPQWLLLKDSTSPDNWELIDTMRGWPISGTDNNLRPNSANAESSRTLGYLTATGFVAQSAASTPSSTFIYIAIRRGPMKVPTSGTSVFSPYSATTPGSVAVTTNFPVDLQIQKNAGAATDTRFVDRLRGVSSTPTSPSAAFPFLIPSSTAAESTGTGTTLNWNNIGFTVGSTYAASTPAWAVNFRRAPGFFDEVCYTGTGAGQVVSHNLGVVPQLMIFKCRSTSATAWIVTNAFTGYMSLNLTTAQDSTTPWDFNGTAPTATQLTTRAASNGSINLAGSTYVAYLFATCAGVSKVGLYTGTGTTLQVDCGFTGGARFVLIKRTDSTGDWYVWDSARGIVSGNDPYLLLNSTAAEVTSTDYIDTYSAGFEISSTAPAAINASGGTFIFLAIA